MSGSGSSKSTQPVHDIVAEGVTSWAVVKDPRKLFFKTVGVLGAFLTVLFLSGVVIEFLAPGSWVSKSITGIPSRVMKGTASTVKGITTDATQGASEVFQGDDTGNRPAAVVMPESQPSDSSFDAP